MKTDPDVQLMLRFKNGDEDAFRMLFSKYQRQIVNFCFRFCPDHELAEDLAQDVFLRVYRSANRYRPDARFTTWIYRIAVNVCLNESRKARYSVHIDSMDHPMQKGGDEIPRELADSKASSISDMLASKQRDELIKRSMSNLPEQQRIAVVLCIYHEFSYREIASQMSVSESKVKTLIFRGRQHLKEILKKQL
jgi:RNA polymerase sigma-70 factor (ECF subfamily)